MIFALYKGERVKASRDLERHEDFLCPNEHCQYREVRLKKGLKRIPHFAHKIKEGVCDKYSEKETDAHIAMKTSFQETLGLDKEYVEYWKIDCVRPDLLWKEKYALEVQHSPIKPEEVERRNQIYQKNGLIPVWVFHMEEMENCAYFSPGKFGKFHDGLFWCLRLNLTERYLAHLQGGLFYLGFSTDEMIGQDEEEYEDNFTLRFDRPNGVSLSFYELRRIENRKSLFNYQFYVISDRNKSRESSSGSIMDPEYNQEYRGTSTFESIYENKPHTDCGITKK